MLSLPILLAFAIGKWAYWDIITLENDSRMRLFLCPRTSEDFQPLWDHTVGLLNALSWRHRLKALLCIIGTFFRLFRSIVIIWCMLFHIIQNAWMNDILSGSTGVFLGQHFHFSAKCSQIPSIASWITLILLLAKIPQQKTSKSTILTKTIQNIWEEKQGK